MHPESTIVDVIRDRQRAMRRELDRRSILMKVISQDSGLDYSTLLTYFPADAGKTPVQIPGSAIFALCGNVPDDILSHLLPTGRVIVRVPEAVDHDEAAEAMRAYLDEKDRSHHPLSEEGRELGPTEKQRLSGKFLVVTGGKAMAA